MIKFNNNTREENLFMKSEAYQKGYDSQYSFDRHNPYSKDTKEYRDFEEGSKDASNTKYADDVFDAYD